MGEVVLAEQYPEEAPKNPIVNTIPTAKELANVFLQENSWLLTYTAEHAAAQTARQIRMDGLEKFIHSSIDHYEQLSGVAAPRGFLSELSFQIYNPNSETKFWNYSSLALHLAERVPEKYYCGLGASSLEDLAQEVQLAIDSCLIWVLCDNKFMRRDILCAEEYYFTRQRFLGYPKNGIPQGTKIHDMYGRPVLTILLHLFPDFIPNQGKVIKQMGLVRRKGAVEFGILSEDLTGAPCYSTNYNTIAWGYYDESQAPWTPRPSVNRQA